MVLFVNVKIKKTGEYGLSIEATAKRQDKAQ